ncbi:MAG: glycosyltransferase [Verrucomicrobia bacterium]|nr:glycosyltransferase [Verrucomicrobiota bacterium]
MSELNNIITNPKVTVVLLAYNQNKFITEAVKALFAQTYQPLELILSDDCSADETFETINKLVDLYSGPHQIKINRNIVNCGTVPAHLNNISHLVSGEWVVLAAGDDISEPQRVQSLINTALMKNGCTLAYSARSVIDEHSKILINKVDVKRRDKLDAPTLTLGGTNILGAVLAFHRSAWIYFGNMPPHIRSEDKILAFRSLLLGSSVYVDEPLVRYRRHSMNMTESEKHKTKTSLSLKNYMASQVAKYQEQLAYFLAFEVDLKFFLERQVSPKASKIQLLQELQWAIVSRKNYIKYLKASSSEKIKNFLKIRSFFPILKVEKNRTIIIFSAIPLLGKIVNGSIFIIEKTMIVIRQTLTKILQKN